MQRQLDALADSLGIGEPTGDQSLKPEACPYAAGTIACLNAADPLCNTCAWWASINEEEEDD
jgi:hypothetical protein